MKNLKEVIAMLNETNESAKKVLENQRKISKFLRIELETVKENNYDDTQKEDAQVKFSKEKELLEFLVNIGVPAHVKGYRYLIDAIKMVLEDGKRMNYITKYLYPEIAKRYKTKVMRVEKNIRHAIEISWERGDVALQKKIFGYTIDDEKSRPMNSEFIAMVSEYIRLNIF